MIALSKTKRDGLQAHALAQPMLDGAPLTDGNRIELPQGITLALTANN